MTLSATTPGRRVLSPDLSHARPPGAGPVPHPVADGQRPFCAIASTAPVVLGWDAVDLAVEVG